MHLHVDTRERRVKGSIPLLEHLSNSVFTTVLIQGTSPVPETFILQPFGCLALLPGKHFLPSGLLARLVKPSTT